MLLGRRISELGLEGADLLLCIIALLASLVTLSDGLVMLLVSRAMLRVKPFQGLQ